MARQVASEQSALDTWVPFPILMTCTPTACMFMQEEELKRQLGAATDQQQLLQEQLQSAQAACQAAQQVSSCASYIHVRPWLQACSGSLLLPVLNAPQSSTRL